MFNQFEVVVMIVIAIGIGYLLCFLKYSAKIFHLQREYGHRMFLAAKAIEIARWQIDRMQRKLDEYERKS